ncbi:MAG: four helix bundle protein [Bacteroidales bacterium]
MKNVLDHSIVEKSFEASVRIYQLCNKFPDSETFGLVYLLKDACLSHSAALNQLLYCSNNHQSLVYLEDALHSMRKIMTGMELSGRIGLITEDEMLNINNPLSCIIEYVCDQISFVKEEIEKEISRMEMSIFEGAPISIKPFKKGFDT